MARTHVLLLAVALGGACQRGDGDVGAPAQRGAPPVQAPAPPASDAPMFMGRPIAQTMGHLGAPWLTRPERDQEENTTLLHEQLRLRPGQVACDIGAGNGYHTLRMATAVSPEGKAVAVDIQSEMLDLLRARATEQTTANIEYVLGEQGDPKLGAARCDLILLVDVYHEFADPEAMLGHMRTALKPDGVVALAEFRAEDPAVPIKPLHKMSKAQARKEFEAHGFELVREFDDLPWQHLLFFAAKR